MARIELWNGDICDLEVDAIVNAANLSLWMSTGVGGALKRAGGDAIEFAAVRQAPVPLGGAIVTPAGNLAAKVVIHAVSLDRDRPWQVPIVRTEAAKGEGVAELAEKIAEHREHIEAEGTLEERRARNLRNEVLELAASRMRRRLEAAVADDSSIRELLDRVVKRELDPASAAKDLLEREDG